MENKLENRFSLFYLIGFFLILALPLLNLPPWFSPPDWGKTVIFRIIFALILFIFLWEILSGKTFSIKTSLAFWLLIAFFCVFCLSTIFSLDRLFSVWGSPYRGDGGINVLFYIIFAIFAFLILKKSDWRKLWNFALIIAILVSVVAILQQYKIGPKIFVHFETRPPSTIGGPIFLGIYLLLFSFLTAVSAVQEKNPLKKLFYCFTLLMFLFVIFLTGSRAVYIGLTLGILYFLFFYPKKITWVKILVGLILIFGVFGIYYLNTHSKEILGNEYVYSRPSLASLLNRFTVYLFLIDPRPSGWKVAFQAMQHRPILGYGPDNFAIAFDKYYDSGLPYIDKYWGSWWDRAHGFVFDIGTTLGVPALILYLAIFGVLFLALQKLKKNPEKALLCHGLQATFFAYLASNLISFDTFSSYIILFLLIAFSFYLISKEEKTLVISLPHSLLKWKGIIISLFLILLIWFAWSFNLKPLQINSEINIALTESKAGFCESALNRMESILPTNTFLNNYIGLKFVDIADKCIIDNPNLAVPLSQKAITVLEKSLKVRPTYTRNWLLVGAYTNILIEGGQENLKQKAVQCFEKAQELSPKRQETFFEWTKLYILTGEYEKAKEKAETCIDLNPEIGDCWWYLSLTNLYLDEKEQAKENMEKAAKKGFLINQKTSLLQLAKVYGDIENYQELIEIYEKLIEQEPENPQYFASLAFVYKELGEIEKARQEAMKVLKLMPEAKEDVERFLEELSH